MKVSEQGKLEFESDLSKILIKLKRIDDFAKTLLSLQRPHCTFEKVNKTKEIVMVLTRPWGIGVGVIWPVVILRLKH